jgi:hypothetical protein
MHQRANFNQHFPQTPCLVLKNFVFCGLGEISLACLGWSFQVGFWEEVVFLRSFCWLGETWRGGLRKRLVDEELGGWAGGSNCGLEGRLS